MKNPILGAEELFLGLAFCLSTTLIFSNIYPRLVATPWPIELELYRHIGKSVVAIPIICMGLMICLPFSFFAGWLYSRRPRIYAFLIFLPIVVMANIPSPPWEVITLANALILIFFALVGARLGASIQHRWRIPAIFVDLGTSKRRIVARCTSDMFLLLFFVVNLGIWSNVLWQQGRYLEYPLGMFIFFGICLFAFCVLRYFVRGKNVPAYGEHALPLLSTSVPEP